jgi:hypothetical protein
MTSATPKRFVFALKEVAFGNDNPPLKYADLLMLLLQSPSAPGKGMKKMEVKIRTELMRYILTDKLGGPGMVVLTEKAYMLVKKLADNYLWGSATFQLEQFLNDLDACPEYHEDIPGIDEGASEDKEATPILQEVPG